MAKKNFFSFKIITTLIGLALIIYVAVSPLTILFKVTMINFFVFLTAQLFLKYKSQRMSVLNIGWFTVTLVLMALLLLAETGKI